MRLLFLTETHPPDRGGMSESCDRILRGLAREGVRLDVVHFDRRASRFEQRTTSSPEHEAAVWRVATANCRFVFAGDERRRPAVATLHEYWLIVHSGPEDEVRELVAYAQELMNTQKPEQVLVATRCAMEPPEGFALIDAYPVTHLFEHAMRIISGAGFNVMLETEPWRDKHHVIPFARKFDDQFARARARRVQMTSGLATYPRGAAL